MVSPREMAGVAWRCEPSRWAFLLRIVSHLLQKESQMKTPMFPGLRSTLNSVQNLPTEVAESSWLVRDSLNRLNKTMTVVAVMLFFVGAVIVMGWGK